MKVTVLNPVPTDREAFRRDRERFIPSCAGCYVLTTFTQDVLYVGLATNLRRRFTQHLDSPDKTAVTPLGRAILFWWIETPDTNKVERTWMNMHVIEEASLPILNKSYSPISI